MPAQIDCILNQHRLIVELLRDLWMHPSECTPSFHRAQGQVAIIGRFEHGRGVAVDRDAVDLLILTTSLSEADTRDIIAMITAISWLNILCIS
jgi:hypothetical protein